MPPRIRLVVRPAHDWDSMFIHVSDASTRHEGRLEFLTFVNPMLFGSAHKLGFGMQSATVRLNDANWLREPVKALRELKGPGRCLSSKLSSVFFYQAFSSLPRPESPFGQTSKIARSSTP